MKSTVRWLVVTVVLLLGSYHPTIAIAGIVAWAFTREFGR